MNYSMMLSWWSMQREKRMGQIRCQAADIDVIMYIQIHKCKNRLRLV